MDGVIQTCSGLLDLINTLTTIPILQNDPFLLTHHEFSLFYEKLVNEYRMIEHKPSLSEATGKDKIVEADRKKRVGISITPSARSSKRTAKCLSIRELNSPTLAAFEEKQEDDISLLLKQLS
eukprot:TRINITY_DN16232_c0_g1_i2.p1 TRINITY_DN16232_c0_g1~~TRINITY_DN16232_c0_g1_i2.p1  ORF type:complete len:122 (+),score=32.89 TRINITY_DN16232_c0_g1_i2:283-648(+)